MKTNLSILKMLFCLNFIALFAACTPDKQEVTPTTTNPIQLFQKSLESDLNVPTNGYIVMSSTDNKQGEHSYDLGALFFATSSKTGIGLNGGNISIGSFQSNPKAHDGQHSYQNKFVGSNYQQAFGKKLTLQIAGSNAIQAFGTDMYFPKEIALEHNAGYFLSKSAGTNLTWNADADNSLGVAVAVLYDGFQSNQTDPNLSNKDILFYKVVPDNGKYSITSTDLKDIPVGGYCRIYVVRGNAKIVASEDGRKYDFFTYTSSTENVLLKN